MPKRIVATPYYGGKAKGQIFEVILRYLEHSEIYVEPFSGAATILLNRRPSTFEVLNDVDGNVANFFRALRDDGDELIRRLKLTPYSRDEFEVCKHNLQTFKPTYLKDVDHIERARWWYVCVAQSRAGEVALRWKIGRIRDETCFANRIDDQLPLVAERLRRVAIHNDDAVELVSYYNSEVATCYCDPPYPLGTRQKVGKYQCDSSDDLHKRLLDAVTADDYKAQCVISSYANPLYDERLKDWHRIEVEVCGHAADGGSREDKLRTEVLYVNRMPKRQSMALFDHNG